MRAQGISFRPFAWALVGSLVGTLVACRPGTSDDPADGSGGKASGGAGGSPSGGMGGATGGIPSDGGAGGLGGGGSECVPKLYDIDELCTEQYSGGFVDYSIPEDPINDPKYSCTAEHPGAHGGKILYRYREGCGRAEWSLLDPSPPDNSVVWDLATTELLGCSYGEDVPVPGQCGGYRRYAGQKFDCAEAEERYCLLDPQGVGGAGGAG